MKRLMRIRLTDYCNKKCPYCFAKDWLDHENSNISLEDYEIAMQYIAKAGGTGTAWQGGEPLIHPKILDIIRITKKYGMKVVIFSNGIFNPEIIPELKEVCHWMVINYNHPSTYSPEAWETVHSNMQLMKGLYHTGYNIHELNPDYQFFLDTIDANQLKKVRFDLVRPSKGGRCNIPIEKLKDYSGTVLRFMKDCLAHGAEPEEDCTLPPCMFKPADFEFIRKYSWKAGCTSDVDVSGGLYVSSCFCSVTTDQLKLTDFESYEEARGFIGKEEDRLRWQVPSKPSCEKCVYWKRKLCQGSCLGYAREKDEVVLTKEHLLEFRKLQAAKACYNTGAYLQAIGMLEEYLKAHNDYEGEYYLGLSYSKVANIPAAVEHLQAAHKLNPNHLELIIDLATALFSAKRNEEARAKLLHCKELFPELELPPGLPSTQS